MKRIVALLIVAVMALTMFAACGGGSETKPTEKPTDEATDKPTEAPVKPTEAPEEPDLEAAKELLKSMHKQDGAKSTPRSFDVEGQLKIGKLTYTIEWKSSIEAVTIAESKNAGYFTVVIPETNETETEYTLTATIKYGDQSVELVLSFVLPVINNAGIVSDLQENVAYKMFLYQAKTQQRLYALTEIDNGKYYKTTNDPKQAPDFFAEAVEGGYKFYTTIDGKKQYVDAYLDTTEDPSKPSKRLRFADTTENVWSFDSEKNAWLVTINGTIYAIGTYNTFTTVSISDATYITAENTGVTQFPVGFMTKDIAETLTPDEKVDLEIPQMQNPLEPVEGTVYRFGFVHGGKENAVYFVTGKLSGYYMETSAKIENGANFYVEAVEGGFHIYTAANKDAKKTYLNVVVSGTHINAKYEDTASTVYTWDAKLKTLKTNIDGTDYIFGTSAAGTYTTIGPVKTVDNFYAQFVAAPEGAEDDKPSEGPQEVTLADAPTLDDGTEVILKGVVTKINAAWSDQYNNISVTITDATGSFYLYKLATKVELGDFITVKGSIGSYKDSKQLAQGGTAEIASQTSLDKLAALEDGTSVVIKGKVSEINTAWSDQHNNISVTISDGENTFYVFRLATKVELGDTIVVVGKVGSYNGNKQIAAGAYAVITEKAPAAGETSFDLKASEGTLADDKLSITWDAETFTVIGKKEKSTNAIRTNDTDHFRVYKDAKLTISAKDGKKITKAVFTTTTKDYAEALKNSISGEGLTVTVEGTVVTVTVSEGEFSELVIIATAQTRISNITLTLA